LQLEAQRIEDEMGSGGREQVACTLCLLCSVGQASKKKKQQRLENNQLNVMQ